ncbi:hypothetical protein [Dietzia cinnamea]|uniref:hypothetical protein n=1 Tax=Dietzia cinnamea TaxID=321318 RepID=UPI0021A50981|nr:hypothetical protein [Dietzia cinnamea]MCT2121751.1 hypothetical protein [Dietzia cinnamea]MCT2145793.1 hypothetical protein [Dietzia cinnamea]MCT2305987.1 hypothetical protein [Dietzia cinnamea]
MEIRAVYLHDASAAWLNDLCRMSADLARFSNELVSGIDFDTLEPGWRAWDDQNGTGALRDPLRNSLKVQKFAVLAGNGLLFSAAHSATNSLVEGGFHPYTPLATGVLCRSAVEQLLYSHYLLSSIGHEELAARVFKIYSKGIRDYRWSGRNRSGRASLIDIFAQWAEGRNIPKKPVYDPAGLLNAIVEFDDAPYSYLSDFVHGNPLTTALSVVDAQEDLGFNRQYDFWSLAIAFVVSLSVSKIFAGKYPHVVSGAQLKQLGKFEKFSGTLSLRAVESWGPPKEIPDRDFD